MNKLTREQLRRKMKLTKEEQEELDRIIEAREIEQLRQTLTRI